MSYIFNNNSTVSFADNATIDAFGRLRASAPYTLFDSAHRYQDNGNWATSNTSGNSTFGHATNQSLIELSVTTANNAEVIRETNRVFAYQPGKSLLIMNTFAMEPPKANLRQRVGYCSADNGIFFENDGNTTYFVLRSNTSSVVTETRVAQQNWNVDKFDGTGYSTQGTGAEHGSLNISKTNILWMDFEWLGVGDVRVGFFVDGKPVIAHTFHNDNIHSTTYMTTACLPLRFEIENLSTTSSSSTAKQICNSVMSEAGYEGFSKRYNVTKNGSSSTTLTTAGTQYPMIGIRMNSSRLDSVVIPSDISAVLEQTASNKPDTVLYRILINPTVTGGSWSTHSNGNVDYNITASSVAGGTDLIGGYISSQGC